MTTVHVSIGNTDGKLSHAEWAEFFALVDELLTGHVDIEVFGRWHSLPATPYVNACWAVEIPDELADTVRIALGSLARGFRQDSIAWLAGHTEFILGAGHVA